MESTAALERSGRVSVGPWDGFLVGPENALAHAAVQALARGEREGFSPLVIHGPAGVGKSRILAGLVSETLQRRPGAAVGAIAAEEFAAACAEAATKSGGWADVRERFRRLDVFVLDDLHALASAPLALAELAHTLDELDRAGAAIAVTARTGPGQWAGLPPRVVSRLGAGLAARIEPPCLDTRRRFVLARARARGLTMGADAVERLAEAADGFCTLEGLLTRLTLEARIGRRPVDEALVAGALAEPGIEVPARTIDEVAKAVASRFGISVRTLRSAARHQGAIGPRHLAMYLARLETGCSFAVIGAYFGHRDPATVRHACRMAEQRLAADPALAAVASALNQASRFAGSASRA